MDKCFNPTFTEHVIIHGGIKVLVKWAQDVSMYGWWNQSFSRLGQRVHGIHDSGLETFSLLPDYGPCARGNHRSPMDAPRKALIISVMFAWTSFWTKNATQGCVQAPWCSLFLDNHLSIIQQGSTGVLIEIWKTMFIRQTRHVIWLCIIIRVSDSRVNIWLKAWSLFSSMVSATNIKI